MDSLSRRTFLRNSLIISGSTFAITQRGWAAPNQVLRAAVVGMGVRGKQLTRQLLNVEGVQITWFIDADLSRAEAAKRFAPEAQAAQDIRKALDDKHVDLVIIASCNHWHCLSAIWACQAGKDVYVEKPLGHNIFEQRRLVEVVEATGRIVQVGTQQRSDAVQDEIRAFLHEEKGLGEIKYIRANRYGVRKPVNKADGVLKIPSEIDYDLWCGPAEKRDLRRDRVHYDWHWDWNTGNGEMGNWGVHIIDDVRNVGFNDTVGMPKRILTGGGRLLWDDGEVAETPNVHFAYFETGSVPVLFDLSNVPLKPGSDAAPAYMGTRSGYTVHCEGGRYSGGRGGGAAYDSEGKRIRKFNGNGGGGHVENFVEAVRERKRSILNADVLQGHFSSAWCELANVGYRVGSSYGQEDALAVNGANAAWSELLAEANRRLGPHDLSLTSPGIALSPLLELDEASERFVGPLAENANQYLLRDYRPGYELPEV